MQFFIVFVAFVALVVADKEIRMILKLSKIISGCLDEMGIVGSLSQPELELKRKCYIHCFLKKNDLMVNGEVKSDVVIRKLSWLLGSEVLQHKLGICNSLKGTDSCDTAYKVYQCYVPDYYPKILQHKILSNPQQKNVAL